MTFTQQAKAIRKDIMTAIRNNEQNVDGERLPITNAERDRFVYDAVSWLINMAEEFKDCANAYEKWLNIHEITIDFCELNRLVMDEAANRTKA